MAGAVAASPSAVDWLLAGIAAVLMAFDRAHYPADVVVGPGLGVVVAIARWLIARRAATKGVPLHSNSRLRRLVTTPHAVAASPWLLQT